MNLKKGDVILYEGSEGIVKSDKKGFYVEWEDITDVTRLDGSEWCKSILSSCSIRRRFS